MGLTRKVPAEMMGLTQEGQGEPERRNRFASAKFKVHVQPAQEVAADQSDGPLESAEESASDT